MSNGTAAWQPEMMRDRLRALVDQYHGTLCADERRLLEAMLEFERSCWAERAKRVA
jgi:hypothetical protein